MRLAPHMNYEDLPKHDVSRMLRRRAKGLGAASAFSANTVRQIMLDEADFQQMVMDRARLRGWKVWHQWSSRHTRDGWPDLVLVRSSRGELVYAELKREGGCPTPAQLDTLMDLADCGAEVYLWVPSDEEEWQGVIDR